MFSKCLVCQDSIKNKEKPVCDQCQEEINEFLANEKPEKAQKQ